MVTSAVAPVHLAPLGFGDGRIFFNGEDANGDREPWVSDGTVAGTFRLADLHPAASSLHQPMGNSRLGDGALILFRARDPNVGIETFLTDGTNQGTKLAFDQTPGINTTTPAWAFVPIGGNVVFHGDDGIHGGEPYAFSLVQFGGTLVEEYGVGCKGGAGIPRLTAVGAPAIGNSSFALEISKLMPNGIAIQVVSAKPAAISLPPCTLLVDLSGAISEGKVADASGVVSIPLPVPLDPKLLGIQFYSQAISIDNAGALLQKFALSNGLRVLVGR
ncbi:MAG: hypothetical protein KDC95_04010 [Planctomycetes bacterium]|nr:hypothetical protein [Planctomycetota bacterium]